MAAPARKQNSTVQPVQGLKFPPPPAAELVTEAGQHNPLPSPAHAIQAQLQSALDSHGFAQPHVEKWPLNKALALMIGASVGLWAAIGAGIALALR